MTLYLRNARRLGKIDASRARIVEGDVLDAAKLREAMKGQDVVYANLASDVERMAKTIVDAMKRTNVMESAAATCSRRPHSPAQVWP